MFSVLATVVVVFLFVPARHNKLQTLKNIMCQFGTIKIDNPQPIKVKTSIQCGNSWAPYIIHEVMVLPPW